MQTFNPYLWGIAGGAPPKLDTLSEPSNWCDPNVVSKNSVKTRPRPRQKLCDLLQNNFGCAENVRGYERELVTTGQILPANVVPNAPTCFSHVSNDFNNLSGDLNSVYDGKDARSVPTQDKCRNNPAPSECFDDGENVLYDADFVKYNQVNPFIDETSPFEIVCGYRKNYFEMNRDDYSNVSAGQGCGRDVSGLEDTFATPRDGSEQRKYRRHLDWRPLSHDNNTWLSIPNL